MAHRAETSEVYAFMAFFPKIPCDASARHTPTAPGTTAAAAAAACRNVWVETERDHSKEVTQPQGSHLSQHQELSLPFSQDCFL